MLSRLIFSLLTFCLATPAWSQALPPPPTLVVTEGETETSLAITALDVQAHIVGHLAETSLTLTFFNPTRRARWLGI
jgi:hypothetical protein